MVRLPQAVREATAARPSPKRHGAELGHRAGVSRERADRARARAPSPSMVRDGVDETFGLRKAWGSQILEWQ